MQESVARCVHHPRRRARASCTACWRALCKSCRRTFDDRTWCEACLVAEIGASAVKAAAEAAGEPDGPDFHGHHDGYDDDADEDAADALVRSPAADPPAQAEAAQTPTPPSPPPSPPPPWQLPASDVAEAPVTPAPPGLAIPPAPPVPPAKAGLAAPALLVLLVIQLFATVLAGFAVLRARDALREVEALRRAPAPAPAHATGAPPPEAPTAHPLLRAPSLEVRDGAALRGAPVVIRGSAPEAEVAALEVDGKATVATTVIDGRFTFEDVPLAAGEHEVSVIAYLPEGYRVRSVPVFVRYEPPAATPTPRAVPAPTASPAIRPVPPPTPPRPPAPSPSASPSASPAMPGGRARNILRGPAEKTIALTFDGGSHAAQATEILDALRAKQVRSTIFLTGDFIRQYPEITRRIAADGHEIGNHTATHPHLADWVDVRGHVTRKSITREALLEELERARTLYEDLTGRKMTRYWRAPYGEINDQLLAWAQGAGWLHVGWTSGLDTLDWVSDPSDRRYRSARQIRERLLAAARSGEPAAGGIVLMHLGGERTDDQPSAELPRIIDGLRSEGYRVVTVSALLGG